MEWQSENKRNPGWRILVIHIIECVGSELKNRSTDHLTMNWNQMLSFIHFHSIYILKYCLLIMLMMISVKE